MRTFREEAHFSGHSQVCFLEQWWHTMARPLLYVYTYCIYHTTVLYVGKLATFIAVVIVASANIVLVNQNKLYILDLLNALESKLS